MALVKYGPIVQEASGTIGGVVFARVRGGKTARGWRAPTNRRTVLQRTSRRLVDLSSRRWLHELTGAQRTAWDSYAATREFTNSLGEAYFLNGFNAYVQLNASTHRFHGGFEDAAPILSGFPQDSALGLELNKTTGVFRILSIVPTVLSSSDELFIFVHSIIPVTRTFPKSPVIAEIQLDGLDTLPQTIHTYDAPIIGGIGDYMAHIRYRWFDSVKRLSKLVVATQPSEEP